MPGNEDERDRKEHHPTAACGKTRRAPISAEAPSIDGGKSRHGVRPRETRPEQPRRAEQKARRQTEESFETAKRHLHDTQKQRTRLRPPKDLLQRHDFSPALYEPYLELLCLLDG